MKTHSIWKWFGVLLTCASFWGCATPPSPPVQFDAMDYPLPEEPSPRQTASFKRSTPPRLTKPNLTITERIVTEHELERISAKDPSMSRVFCLDILARLNGKARNYIADDIRSKQRIKAPADFFAYRYWTPLPRDLAGRIGVPKFILIVKDIPFIGWYENAGLKGDSQICIGKMWGWTHAGYYSVLQKDPDHISQSYTNAYGQPAFMPFALWIYARVWIHAGDVTGGYCSHGCINLTVAAAESLYDWADIGTPVLIIDSLKDLDKGIKKYSALNPKPKVETGSPPAGPQRKQPRTSKAQGGRSTAAGSEMEPYPLRQ